jgi:hypothetical protein
MMPGGASFGFMGGDDPTSLLNIEQVQQELELIDSQMEDVRKLYSEMNRKQAELMRRMAKDGLRQPDVAAALQEELKEIRAETQGEIEKLLLPHQSDRLQQIARHMMLQRRGTANALTSELLAKELGLTDEQKERLQTRAKEVEDEVRQEMARLRKMAHEKILGELTAAQRDKLAELLGKDFEAQMPALPRRAVAPTSN